MEVTNYTPNVHNSRNHQKGEASMGKKDIVDTLNELASSTTKRSNAARLREIIDVVETTLAAGASRETVHKALLDHGFTFSLKGFEITLYRIRKARAAERKQAAAQPSAAKIAGSAKENDSRASTADHYVNLDPDIPPKNPLAQYTDDDEDTDS